MKKILIFIGLLVNLTVLAQVANPAPFNVAGAATFNSSYSSGQYHYKRTTLDTVYADGHELLVIDDSTNTTTVTVHFPSLVQSNAYVQQPYPGEFFSIVSMDSIPSLILASTPTIQGNVTTLGANQRVSWVYTYSAISKAYVWLKTSNTSILNTILNNYVPFGDSVSYFPTVRYTVTATNDTTYAGFAHQTLAVGGFYIITGAGTITADTITLPAATNGSYIDVLFNRAVTTVSYGSGSTGVGQIYFVAATAGQFKRFTWLNGFWH